MSGVPQCLPLIFLQYCPVGCKVRENLPERFFLELALAFAMLNILNYNYRIKQFNQYIYIVNHDLVVVRVVFEKFVFRSNFM